jgi:hypothetical protein
MSWWTQLNNLDNVKGNDYSRIYTKNKNAFMYIGKEGDDEALIVFKPFLSNLSYDLKIDTKDSLESDSVQNSPKIITGSDISIKVELDIPATSVSEADANAARVATFLSWMQDQKLKKTTYVTKDVCSLFRKENAAAYHDGKLTETAQKAWESDAGGLGEAKLTMALACAEMEKNENSKSGNENTVFTHRGKKMVFLVSFANLIQSGNYTEEHEILNSKSEKTYDNLQLYGLRCLINNLKVNIDVDMGYFEFNDLLLPKSYKLSFNIELINELLGGEQKNIVGIGDSSDNNDHKNGYEESSYHTRDIVTWPFGVPLGKNSPQITNNYSYVYANNRSAFIEMKKHSVSVSFMPYITSLSIERGINTKSLHEFKHLTGKDRLIFATKQPNYNISFDVNAINLSHAKTIHLNIQNLLRMIYPKQVINLTTVSRLLVKFKNIIGVKGQFFETEEFVECICTDLNVKPNLDMGFFEDDGMLYFKSFSLNLSLQSNDSDFGE